MPLSSTTPYFDTAQSCALQHQTAAALLSQHFGQINHHQHHHHHAQAQQQQQSSHGSSNSINQLANSLQQQQQQPSRPSHLNHAAECLSTPATPQPPSSHSQVSSPGSIGTNHQLADNHHQTHSQSQSTHTTNHVQQSSLSNSLLSHAFLDLSSQYLPGFVSFDHKNIRSFTDVFSSHVSISIMN